jgi:opacity family porin
MRDVARMLIVSVLAAAAPTPADTAQISRVEGMTATVLQKGQSSFSGLGLRLRLQPATLPPGFSLMPTIEYWRNTSNIRPFGIEATRKDATLSADLRYDFAHTGWQPYAGVGFAVHFISSEVDAPTLGLDKASDSLIKGGVAALGGVSFALTDRFANLLELKYHHVPDHSQLKINWGISYKLN